MRYLPSSDDCLRLCSFKADQDPQVLRWNAIVALLYATGARTAEIADLRIMDVSVDARGRTTFSIRGDRRRLVAVNSRAAELLWRFVGPRPHREHRRIFDAARQPLDVRALRRELAERSRRLGLPATVSPTDLQAACIRDLLASGMRPEDVAQQIGVKVRSMMKSTSGH
jgi:site-specific recombinase XerD